MTKGTIIRLAEGHLASELDEDEIVILNVQNGQYYSLDGVGAFVWKRLENAPSTQDQLVEAVTAEYDTDANQCRHDLASFLSDMSKQGLIELCNEAT